MLRVRHKAHHVTRSIADARDVINRSVRVNTRVSEHNASFGLQLGNRLGACLEVSLTVLQRDKDFLALAEVARPRGVGIFHDEFLLAADKSLLGVADERTRKQMRFA